MLRNAAIPMVFTLLAVSAALLAARGKWVVYRLVLGAISIFFTLSAGVGWLVFGIRLGQAPTEGAEVQPYIGWNPVQMSWFVTLPGVIVVLAFLSLVVAAGRSRARAKRQGKA